MNEPGKTAIYLVYGKFGVEPGHNRNPRTHCFIRTFGSQIMPLSPHPGSSSTAASQPPALLEWRWKPFDALTPHEIYAILAARNAVFIVEQHCVYGDVDGVDQKAWHLGGYDEAGRLACYVRVWLSDAPEPDVLIGRVLTTQPFRGMGVGNAMLGTVLERIREQWPNRPISLHAQAHLQAFYRAFGFAPSSDVHDEDGIAHVWMRLPA